jgi:hypothetical protein
VGNAVDNFRKNIETVGEKYFIDVSEETIGNKTLNHYKLNILGMTYMLDENGLVKGEPGFG